MIGKALVVWLVMLVVAILNAVFRNAMVAPRLGEHAGHLISTATACAAFLVLIWFTLPWIDARGRRDLFLIGVLWVILTVGFEFLAGHYLFGSSWDKLLADYNVFRGRVWVAVLIVLLLGPLWIGQIRNSH